MANTQHIHVILFLLVITACLEIQFADGRQIKATKEHKLSPVKIETGLENHAKHATKVERSLRDQKDNPRDTQPKKVLPPITPTQSDKLNSSDVSRKDTFQPMTQGSSPGVGHSFPGKSPNMQPKVQDFRVTAGKTDAFQSRTQTHGNYTFSDHNIKNYELEKTHVRLSGKFRGNEEEADDQFSPGINKPDSSGPSHEGSGHV